MGFVNSDPKHSMRAWAAVLGAVLIMVAPSCGYGNSAGDASSNSAAPTTAVERPLADVFAPLPAGYVYGDVRPDLAERIKQGAEAKTKGASSILSEIIVREVTYGGVLVATTEAFRLSPSTGSGERAGIVLGIEKAVGGTRSVVGIANKQATLISGDVSAVVYESGNTMIVVIGEDHSVLRAVGAVLIGTL